MTSPFDLTGRSALLTGAGNGIGASVARAYARAGAAVMVTDLDKDAAAAVAAEVVAAGGRAESTALDVRDAEGAAAAAEQAALELAHAALIADLTSRWPGPACDLDPDLVKDSIEQLLHAVWAALLTTDPRPISQTAGWVTALLEFRRLPPALATSLRDELTRALRDYPLASFLFATSWT